jgi:hypothetical protein
MVLTLLECILIREVEVEILSQRKSKTECEAVGSSPVGIIVGGAESGTVIRVMSMLHIVLIPVRLIIDSTLIVVTGTNGYVRNRLYFNTELEGMHALERLFGVVVYRAVIVREFVRCVYAAVFGILVRRTNGNDVAERVTQGCTELPWS